jgi:hypothetical protein
MAVMIGTERSYDKKIACSIFGASLQQHPM